MREFQLLLIDYNYSHLKKKCVVFHLKKLHWQLHNGYWLSINCFEEFYGWYKIKIIAVVQWSHFYDLRHWHVLTSTHYEVYCKYWLFYWIDSLWHSNSSWWYSQTQNIESCRSKSRFLEFPFKLFFSIFIELELPCLVWSFRGSEKNSTASNFILLMILAY